jgi:hypothetical protein
MMAGPGSGLSTQLCMIDEATYGVAPALTGALFYEFTSEQLKSKKTTVQGIGLHPQALHGRAARRVLTNWEAAGPIAMDLPDRQLNKLLFRMFGSYGQAKATLTQDASTGAYSAVHAPGDLGGHSFVIQKGVPAVDNAAVEPFTYVGCKIADWEISVQTGEIAKLALTIDARNELAGGGNADPLNGSVPGLLAFTSVPGGVFHFAEAALYTGGTPSTSTGVTSVSGATLAGNIKSANVKYTIPYDSTRFFLGGAGFKSEQIQNALRTIGGQFVVEWLSSEAMYNTYAADTATTLELRFTGAIIGSGADHSMLSILVPNIHLDGDAPEVPGPAVITQTVPFTGLDDGTNNPIQATYWTLDTV